MGTCIIVGESQAVIEKVNEIDSAEEEIIDKIATNDDMIFADTVKKKRGPKPKVKS